MATPLVAGLVALIKAQDANLTPLQIRSLIQSTGAKVGIETACDCRIDAFGAVDTILSKKMFVSPFAGTYAVGDKVTFEGVYGKAPFTFETSNATVGAIDANGVLTTAAEGETQITVKDSAGVVAQSYKIFVGKPSSGGGGGGGNPPDDGGGGGGGGAPGECPIGDPQICQIICGIQPDLPFCQK
jgi:thermitase